GLSTAGPENRRRIAPWRLHGCYHGGEPERRPPGSLATVVAAQSAALALVGRPVTRAWLSVASRSRCSCGRSPALVLGLAAFFAFPLSLPFPLSPTFALR